jgi:hypothetical protein
LVEQLQAQLRDVAARPTIHQNTNTNSPTTCRPELLAAVEAMQQEAAAAAAQAPPHLAALTGGRA